MFRDFDRQNYLYKNRRKNGNPVARPGTSNHEPGYAFDVPAKYSLLKSKDGKETVQSIFIKHGFLKTVKGDPPHFAWKGCPTGKESIRKNRIVNAWFRKCTSGY